MRKKITFRKLFNLVVAALIMLSMMAPMVGKMEAFAEEPGGSEELDVVQNDIDGPHLTLESVSQYGEEITPVWDEYLYRGLDGSGDFGNYYYPVANNTDNVTLGVRVNGLEEGKTYVLYHDLEVTAADNDTVIYKELRPSASMGQENYAFSNEYTVELTLSEKESWNWLDDVRVILRPQEVGSSDIEILSVKQDGNDVYLDNVGRQEKNYLLPQTINEYQLPDATKPVTVEYKLKNLREGWTYYSYAYSGSGSSNGSFVADAEEKTFTQEVYFSGTKAHDNIMVVMSGNNYKNGQHDYHNSTVNLYFRMTDEDFVAVDKLIIDEVSQGDNAVEPSFDTDARKYTFRANDVQEIQVRLHAIDAMEGVTYYLTSSLNSLYSRWEEDVFEISGSELKNGAVVTLPARYSESNKSPFNLYFYIRANGQSNSRESLKLFYADETLENEYYFYNNYNFYFEFFESEEIARYDFDFKYANYPDIEISENGEVNPKYHDDENPLAVSVSGQYYDEDEDYEVKVKVSDVDGETVYERNFAKTGKELNSGAVLVLEEMVLLPPEANIEDFTGALDKGIGYNVELEIDGLKQTGQWLCSVYDGSVSSVIVTDDGRVNSAYGGGGLGGSYIISEGTEIGRALLENGHTATLNYVGSNFDDDTTYEYDLYYGEKENADFWTAPNVEKIESGTVTGKELNDGRLSFELSATDAGGMTYDLIIKKDGRLIQFVQDNINIWDGAGLSSFTLETDKNVYLQMNKFSYTVPVENDVKVKLFGNEFDEEKEYTVTVRYHAYKTEQNEYGYYTSKEIDVDDLNGELKYIGAELNSGVEYVIEYDERMKEAEHVYLVFDVRDDDEMYPGHIVFLNYVDVEEIISSEKGYQVDNKTGRIKKISHSTSLEELNTALEITDGGSIKLFAADGETEQDGNVGTGMIVRVVDEYERPVLDMEAVVTGDVTGTSTINSADLLGVRRHLIGVSELDGPYREAANVVEDDEINSADLLKFRQHLIGTSEIK